MLKKQDLHICLDCYCDLEKDELHVLRSIETILGRFGHRKPTIIDQNVLSHNLVRMLESFGLVMTTEIGLDEIAILPLGGIIVEQDEDECFFCHLESHPYPLIEDI